MPATCARLIAARSPWAEQAVAADERPVEVARERRDLARKALGKGQAQPLVDATRYCERSAICCGSNCSAKAGMPPCPRVIR